MGDGDKDPARWLLRIQPEESSDEDPNDGSDEDSDEGIPLDNFGITSVFTSDELLKFGLLLVHFTNRRIKRSKKKRNLTRFKSHFGMEPKTAVKIWEDLQTTMIPEARLFAQDRNMKCFLMALHHLKRYPTEYDREAIFDVSWAYGSQKCHFYIEKIKALKKEKIWWPENNFGDDIWAITVDGTHFAIEEPQHKIWSQNKKYFSHKKGRAGLNYELGIAINYNKLVWMNGPYKAGANDVKVFKSKGLKAFLAEKGKKAIGDAGYHGHPNEVSTPNPYDSSAVRKFKTRALNRHEKFNGLIKHFDCLSNRFRHGQHRFKDAFEAVCVICQYKIEIERPLFDVYIEEIFRE